jgi:hypothetical protein
MENNNPHNIHHLSRPPKPARRALSDRTRAYISIINEIAVIAAILATGIWFVQRRETSPKIEISHHVVQRRIHRAVQLMSIDISIENKGAVPARMEYSVFRLQQIVPLNEEIAERLDNGFDLVLGNERAAHWPVLQESRGADTLTVLPGEKRVVTWELGIDPGVKTVRIYTFFSPDKNGKTGWPCASICEIRNGML